MKVKNYTELVAWQKAVELVQAIYDETKVLSPADIRAEAANQKSRDLSAF